MAVRAGNEVGDDDGLRRRSRRRRTPSADRHGQRLRRAAHRRSLLLAGGGLLLAQSLIRGRRWGLVRARDRDPDRRVLVARRPLHAAAERGRDPAALRRLPRHDAACPGLRATNPFYTRSKISLRARNLNGDRLKVNDKRGNPIEIAAVVVWHVDDTAKAAFDVDDYENFVKVQSEAAVRHLASSFAYDDGEAPDDDAREPTLLESADIVAAALVSELQARLDQAGVVVDEARLMHLAYAPEIAQVMLRRQQAEAIIAARQKIVHGAVSMVRDGAARAVRQEGRRARRRAQGRDGVEPHDRAVRRESKCSPSSTPARSTTDGDPHGRRRADAVRACA